MTLHPSSQAAQTTPAVQTTQQTLLKPGEPRKSNDEKSQADSDGSYDVVGAASGAPSQAPSQAPGSPKDLPKGGDSEDDDSEDDDDDDDDDEEDDGEEDDSEEEEEDWE